MREPRICKNPDCKKSHDGFRVLRSLGDDSMPYLMGFCSAQCYTKYTLRHSAKETKKKTMLVTIDEFTKNGGVIEEGRQIFNDRGIPFAEYLKYDNQLQVHLGKNASYKSFPMCSSVDKVQIEVKPIYK